MLAALVGGATAFAPAFVPRSSNIYNAAPASPSALQMVAVDTSDIKNGMTIELDGEPYKVVSFSIMKQARGAAKTTIKFKNLSRGNTLENTYRSGEKFETAMVEKTKAQHTYVDDNNGNFLFMDMETFEEVLVEAKTVEGKEDWISEGMEVNLVSFKGKVIEVDVPKTMVFTILETEPNVKGNTAQGHTKPAKLDCGATINVPGFLDQGARIKVDTEKREYLERAN
jgi:translation elongation factor P